MLQQVPMSSGAPINPLALLYAPFIPGLSQRLGLLNAPPPEPEPQVSPLVKLLGLEGLLSRVQLSEPVPARQGQPILERLNIGAGTPMAQRIGLLGRGE